MNKYITILATAILISGCASTSEVIDKCGNHVTGFDGSNERSLYDENSIIGMYKQMGNGTKASNMQPDLDKITKGTITESGSIDVFLIVKNINKELYINNGGSPNSAEYISSLAVKSFRTALWQNGKSVCSYQVSLAKKQ